MKKPTNKQLALLVTIALVLVCAIALVPSLAAEPNSSATLNIFHTHKWKKATCTKPKTCKECGATEGNPLGHKLEDWKDDGFDSTFSERVYVKTCSRCEKTIEKKTEKVTSFLENEKLTICPDTYSKVFEKRLRELNDSDFTVHEEYDYKLTVYSINDSNDEMAGQLSFSLKDKNLAPTLLYSEPLNYGIVVMLDNNQSNYDKKMARFLVAMIEACDPSLDWDSVGEIVKEIDEQGAASRNGFTYSRTKKRWVYPSAGIHYHDRSRTHGNQNAA